MPTRVCKLEGSVCVKAPLCEDPLWKALCVKAPLCLIFRGEDNKVQLGIMRANSVLSGLASFFLSTFLALLVMQSTIYEMKENSNWDCLPFRWAC